MTTKDLATELDGSEYPLRLTANQVARAKEAGIVIVYGASDDLMEFEGAITDEAVAYEGTTVRLGPSGLLPDYESMSIYKASVRNGQTLFRDQESFFEQSFDTDDLEPMPSLCGSCAYRNTTPLVGQVHRCHSNRGMICLGSIMQERIRA